MKKFFSNILETVVAAAIVGVFTILWGMSADIASLKTDVALLKLSLPVHASENNSTSDRPGVTGPGSVTAASLARK